MEIPAGVIYDSGKSYPSNCFPVRPILSHNEEASGAWLVAQRAEQRRRFKAIICGQPGLKEELKRHRRRSSPGKGKMNASSTSVKSGDKPFFLRETSMLDEMGIGGGMKIDDNSVLDGFFLIRHCHVDDPSDLCSVNVSGLGLSEARPEDFALFDNLVRINAAENLLPLEVMNEFPALQELEVPMCGLRNLRIRPDYFPNLEYLDASYNNLSIEDVLSIGLIPKLKRLQLSGNDFSQLPLDMAIPEVTEDGDVYPRYHNLEILMLDDNKLSGPEVFATLAGLRRLKILNLEKNEITAVPILKSVAGRMVSEQESRASTALEEEGTGEEEEEDLHWPTVRSPREEVVERTDAVEVMDGMQHSEETAGRSELKDEKPAVTVEQKTESVVVPPAEVEASERKVDEMKTDSAKDIDNVETAKTDNDVAAVNDDSAKKTEEVTGEPGTTASDPVEGNGQEDKPELIGYKTEDVPEDMTKEVIDVVEEKTAANVKAAQEETANMEAAQKDTDENIKDETTASSPQVADASDENKEAARTESAASAESSSGKEAIREGNAPTETAPEDKTSFNEIKDDEAVSSSEEVMEQNGNTTPVVEEKPSESQVGPDVETTAELSVDDAKPEDSSKDEEQAISVEAEKEKPSETKVDEPAPVSKDELANVTTEADQIALQPVEKEAKQAESEPSAPEVKTSDQEVKVDNAELLVEHSEIAEPAPIEQERPTRPSDLPLDQPRDTMASGMTEDLGQRIEAMHARLQSMHRPDSAPLVTVDEAFPTERSVGELVLNHMSQPPKTGDQEATWRGQGQPPPPFQALRSISLAHNMISREESLLAVSEWPVLCELIVHDNPLTRYRSGEPTLLRALLVERLGIRIIRVKPEFKPKPPVTVPEKPERKIRTKMPKIPRFDVSKLLCAIESTPSFPREDTPPLPPIGQSREDTAHPDSDDFISPEQSERKKREDTTSPFFMTQPDDNYGDKAYRPPSVQSDVRADVTSPDVDPMNDEHVDFKYDGYEELFEESNVIAEEPVPKDVQGSIRMLKYMLSHPVTFNERVIELDRPQPDLRKTRRIISPTQRPRESHAERVSRTLREQRNREVTSEAPLTEVLLPPRAPRKLGHPGGLPDSARTSEAGTTARSTAARKVDAERLLADIQRKYNAVRSRSMQVAKQDTKENMARMVEEIRDQINRNLEEQA